MKKNFVCLLDSGAYTVWRKGQHIDLEDYAKFVHENRSLFRGGVFNLDWIEPPASAAFESQSAKKSYENWIELRRLGVDSIPVHHVGDDEIYLKKYLDNTDFIGLGAIAKLDSTSRVYGLDRVWNEYLKKADGTPRCRVHGLGLTDVGITLRYPWYSLDSTRAIAAAAYGSILMPKISGSKGISYAGVYPISVSNQARDHDRGKSDSFYAMPALVQRQIREYCNSLGYDLDKSIEGRKLNPKMKSRKRQDAVWTKGFEIPEFDIEIKKSYNGDEQKNLSVRWEPRFILNLHVVDEFIKYWRARGKPIRIYNVVGGGTVFDAFVEGVTSKPAARCLVSYARISKLFLNRLREVF